MANKESFKEAVIEEYEDNIEEVANEFVEALKNCEDDIVGSETVGESIEFFDEDGAVLLLVTLDENTNKANFEFVLSEEVFDLSINNIPEGILESETEDEE